MTRLMRIPLLLCILTAVGALGMAGFAQAQAATATPSDPAFYNPSFAAMARLHPTDWERRTDPSIKPVIAWQRLVGPHAQVVGWSDEAPNPAYQHPRVLIYVANWDKHDLFGLGIPRVYNNKPVTIHDTGKGFFPTGQCSVLNPPRPTQGGLPIQNTSNGNLTSYFGTLGGAVYGQGYPTNPGWKYAISDQHVLADTAAQQAGDIISQPPAGCPGTQQLGYQLSIPPSLALQYNNSLFNANTQDSAVAPLTSGDALSPSIVGIGTPTGSYDPPQDGWCGNASGASSGVTGGCITGHPSIIEFYFTKGPNCSVSSPCPSWIKDMFNGGNSVSGGDSGELWLDYNLRVHGMLVGEDANGQGYFQRWQNVANAWFVTIATQ